MCVGNWIKVWTIGLKRQYDFGMFFCCRTDGGLHEDVRRKLVNSRSRSTWDCQTLSNGWLGSKQHWIDTEVGIFLGPLSF